MKRRFTLLAIATFLSGTLMAQPSQVDGKYQIATKADLEWLADQVNNGTSFNGQQFEQIADIDLGGIQDTAGIWSGAQWTPIGNNSKQFSGTYDGNGKIIKNLYYNNPSAQYVGLFGGINNATLKNITLASGFVYGYQYTGGICGISKGESKITCCANIATVYGKMERIGGVVGQIDGITDVNNCINYGLVSAYNFAGGVVGGRNKSYNQTVSYCINVGQVFTMRSSGNLYGMNNNGYGTTKCYYDNQINASTGWTFNGSSKETEPDVNGQMEGKSINEMTNSNLETLFDNNNANNWVFVDGMYPRLSCNSEQPAIILAATPIFLQSGDKADNVTKDFTVSFGTNDANISWKSGEDNYISINGNSANIKKSTAVVLIAEIEKGDQKFSKKIFLKTNKTGATAIGSKDSPLPIESKEDLIKLRDAMLNYGIYAKCANYDGFKGIHFKVMADIAFNDDEWTEPIGAHNSFKGIFDGNNRSIDNVNVDQYGQGIAIVGGLFGCASYGEIKNLNITSGTVSGIQFVGGLCGSTFREIIKNCSTNCEVSTSNKNNVGGVIGVSKGYSRYEDCINNGNVSGAQYVAGVIASCNTTDTVIRCKNYGEISGTVNVAGVCGNAAGTDCLYSFCENHNSVTCSKATDPNSGGIIAAGAGSGTIENCINSGNVIATGNDAGYCGGIIGHPTGTFTINQCLNSGKIDGKSSGSMGGICGSEGNLTIMNSFNSGEITGSGIVGSLKTGSTCTNCINIGEVTSSANSYYDNQLYPSMNGGTGKKTSQMTGDALDLGTAWVYNEGMYPMPKTLANSDYMIVAATAIILDDADDVDHVRKNFTFGNGNDVEWTCSYPQYISFTSDGIGYLTYYTGDAAPTNEKPLTVTVTKTVNKTKISKTIPLALVAKTKVASPGAYLSPSSNSIEYGTVLTKDLLNPHADCDGEWSYSIALGSKPHAGNHTLTATFIPSDLNSYSIQTVTADFTVNKKEPTIEWTPQNVTYGESDSNSKLKNAVAKDGNIELSGVFTYNIPPLIPSEEPIEITVTFSNSDYETSTPVKKTITVNKAIPTIDWATPAAIDYGTALSDLQLGAVSGIEGTFVYKIGDKTINKGDILNGGKHTITAMLTPNNLLNYDFATKEITLTVAPILPTIVWENPADITFGTLLSDKQLNAKVDGVSGDFTYTPNFGERLKAEKNITLRVDFTPKGSDANNYKATYKEVKINVNKADAIIDWEYPANITYGTLLSEAQLNANVNGVTGEYNYTPALGAKLNAGKHELKVDFTPTGDDINNCNAASKTVILTVDKATPEITWNIAETIIAGTALTEDEHLNATANIGGSFVYKEGENTINEDDVLPAGSHQLTAIFTPADTANYKSKSKSVTVSVAAKTELAITWTAPTPIVYGTLIDSTILNATANIDGTFAYSVKAGDALNAGEHTIVATFTPADNSYSVITDTVLLQVAKANLIVSVADVTVKQGDAIPTFNIAYNGFKLNDNESSLTSQVVATSAASTDKAGTFDIVLSGGQSDNYNFEYQNGKLTITATEDTSAIIETEVAISVYPNPTDGIFMVETDSNVENILIYNAQGALVKVEPNTGKTRIDISDVEQGSYFVKVGEKTIKLLKF